MILDWDILLVTVAMNLANRAMKVKETVTGTLTVLAILFVGKTTAGDLIQHLPQHMIAVKKVGVILLWAAAHPAMMM